MLTIFRHTRQDRMKPTCGFTLVELLVVISIIGILVALLMPAVNSARESGRRATCGNNLHQLALGCLTLESKYQHLPTAGWGWQWAGESDRGFGAQQPGGWHYCILPFIDQVDLFDLDKGLEGPHDTTTNNTKRRNAGQRQALTPIAIFICPTRRKVQAYPYVHSAAYVNIPDPYPVIGRSDYAANGGSNFSTSAIDWSPNQNYDPNFDWSTQVETINSTSSPATGVIFCASQLPMSMIKDGASNTYLIGERYLNPDCYYTGACADDDQGWDQGFDWDTIRGTAVGYVNKNSPGSPPPSNTNWQPNPPFQDRKGFANSGTGPDAFATNFGSATRPVSTWHSAMAWSN